MPRILLLSIFCFFLFGCEEEGGGLIERETDSSPNSSSDNSGSGDDSSESGNDGSTTSGVFSISPFLNATVSTDSVVGTWVAVASGTNSYSELEEGNESLTTRVWEKSQIKVFTINDNNAGLVASECDFGMKTEQISIEGSEIEIFSFGKGKLTNNKYAETTFYSSDEEENYKEIKTYDYKLAKISDKSDHIGTIKINEGSGEDSKYIDCFVRSEYPNIKKTSIHTEGELRMGIEHNHTTSSEKQDVEITVYRQANDAYTKDAHYEFNESELQTMLMTFSGSNDDGQQLSGTLQLNIQ